MSIACAQSWVSHGSKPCAARVIAWRKIKQALAHHVLTEENHHPQPDRQYDPGDERVIDHHVERHLSHIRHNGFNGSFATLRLLDKQIHEQKQDQLTFSADYWKETTPHLVEAIEFSEESLNGIGGSRNMNASHTWQQFGEIGLCLLNPFTYTKFSWRFRECIIFCVNILQYVKMGIKMEDVLC